MLSNQTLKPKNMEIYVKNKQNQLEETTLYNIIELALENSAFKMDNGRFSDGSSRWIEIIQESENTTQVLIEILFDDSGDTITDLNVHETPILRVVDNDNSKKII